MMTRNIDCAWTGELCEEGECLKGKICILSARDRAAWAEPQAAWQAAKPLKPDCRLWRNPATGRRELWVFNRITGRRERPGSAYDLEDL